MKSLFNEFEPYLDLVGKSPLTLTSFIIAILIFSDGSQEPADAVANIVALGLQWNK